MFNCTKCGICCKKIGLSVQMSQDLLQNIAENRMFGQSFKGNSPETLLDAINDEFPFINDLANFPYKTDETGRCPQLADDNTCKVYEFRPLVCNVSGLREKYFPKRNEEDYFRENESICKTLQDEETNRQ